jgi:serine/threonine protein kinase
MGAVYDAQQIRLNKRVAIKVMSRELASNTEALNRFHREAMITSGLGHPHIVQVCDFATTPMGQPLLAMEFLDGEDLDHRIVRVGHCRPSRPLASSSRSHPRYRPPTPSRSCAATSSRPTSSS